MRFGLFGGARTEIGEQASDSQIYTDYVDYICEAEALGFHSVFLVEHHFTGFGQISATLSFLTYLAAKTTRIRLGTAVLVLPWHNPASAGRTGGDIGPAVQRPSRSRHRQGLSLGRVPRLLHSDGGSRRALRRGGRFPAQGVDHERALFASRQALALRRHRHRAGAGAKAASPVVDRRPEQHPRSARPPRADSTCCSARPAAPNWSRKISEFIARRSKRRAARSTR